MNEILSRVPKNNKAEKSIQSQSIFGARGYSIGHYARVVRADVLVMNAKEEEALFCRVFSPKTWSIF